MLLASPLHIQFMKAVLRVESALKEKVRKPVHQVLQINIVRCPRLVARIFRLFHFSPSAHNPKSVELPSCITPDGLFGIARLRAFFAPRRKRALLAAVDALLRPQPLENELRRASLNRRVIFRTHAQRFPVLEKPRYFFSSPSNSLLEAFAGTLNSPPASNPHHSLKIHIREIFL